MRKKILLLIGLVAVASVSFAQTLSQDWNTTIGELRTNAFDNDLVYIDAAGNTYVTGIFTEDVSIGSSYLEQLGESAYLAKLNSAGDILWAVALQGYVTPKQITTDSDGNVYIACIFDGEIILGSTNNATETLTGNDAYGEQKNTVFAKYDANGVLKNSDAYLYDLEDWLFGYAKVAPVGLSVVNNTVYLGLSIAGKTQIGNTEFSGYTFLHEEFYMDINLNSMYILAFDKDLNYQKKVACVEFTDADAYAKITSFTMTADEENLYAAFYAPATLKISAGTASYTIESEYGDDMYYRNFSIFRINPAGNIDFHKSFQSKNMISAYAIGYEEVKHSFISNNAWIITGNYNDTFIFDESAPETGTYDSAPYFVIFNKEAGNETKTYYGETNTTLNSSAVGNALVFSTYNDSDATSTLYAYDFGTRNIATLETTAANTSINGVAASGEKISVSRATAGDGIAAVAVSKHTLSNLSGIETPTAKATEIKLYPNPAVDVINLSEACDVTIVNIQGSVVKAASASTQIPVTELNAGYYVAKIKTTEGVTVIPFIKK
ncbi:MAG: T9SS type A sorting domain-containing protein [Coprobacter sp.]|nr:T9SS type A sorting domain-containing protein [Coprobacter sp.]